MMKYREFVSEKEYIAIILSRLIKDGETCDIGLNSEIPLCACLIAKNSHAPNLKICKMGAFLGKDVKLGLYPSTEYLFWRDGEFIDELDLFVLSDVSSKKLDLFFAGGIQIDMYGNQNLVCVGEWENPKFRGPGSAGLGIATSFAKRYEIFMVEHSKRTFVEKVDFISGIGYGSGKEDREKLGLPYGGPEFVVTPYCIFDFSEEKKMRLKSLHEGVTLDEVLEKTGFNPTIPEKIETTPMPEKEEIEILREVDPLRRLA